MTQKTAVIIIDPLESLNPKKDTTIALLKEASKRNWKLIAVERNQMYVEESLPLACGTEIEAGDFDGSWYRPLQKHKDYPLGEADVILMRKDPPFDIQYIFSTYILELAKEKGVRVINNPQMLRDYNEKMAILNFKDYTPETIVTSQKDVIKDFLAKHKKIVLKPLDSMGGTSIFVLKENDLNINVIIETITENQSHLIMAQRFVEQIDKGDKRVILIDGEPIDHCLARIPAKGEFRGNLAVGATGQVQPISERDREISLGVGKVLKERGVYFAGLDIIGDHLTEINITSPTGVQEIETGSSSDICGLFWQKLSEAHA